MNTILVNVLTHGDELVGKRVADEIRRRYGFLIGRGLDIQIANQRAYSEGKRCIDRDLNRSFPGIQNGSYEEARAFELVPIISSYEVVVDIHSTESGAGDIIIVTKLDDRTRLILESLAPRYVLFMNIKPDNALISCAQVGIALEMGSDKDVDTYHKSLKGVECLLAFLGYIPEKPSFGFSTEYYEVFSQVLKPAGAQLQSHVKNFNIVKTDEVFAVDKNGDPIKAEQDFYPVIFGNSNYETIFGFASRKLTL